MAPRTPESNKDPMRPGWQVWVAKGPNVLVENYTSKVLAEIAFNARWVARLLVDPFDRLVRKRYGLNPCSMQRLQDEWHSQKANTLEVSVDKLSGDSLKLHISSRATIGDVKVEVERLWSVPYLEQGIAHKEAIIADYTSLASIGKQIGKKLAITLVRRDETALLHEYAQVLDEIGKLGSSKRPTEAQAFVSMKFLARWLDDLEDGRAHGCFPSGRTASV